MQAQARVAAGAPQVAQSRAGEQQVKVAGAGGSAAAGIQQARANLAAAELQLGYTTIVAPIDGEVTRKTVEVGQIIQPGQALDDVVPLHDVWVTANFKETQLAGVRPASGPKSRSICTARRSTATSIPSPAPPARA